MNSYIKYSPVKLLLTFIVPAVTAFFTIFIFFLLIALVTKHTVFSLFSTTLGVIFWVFFWLLFQVWIFTPNFKKSFIFWFSKIWYTLWFFANKERGIMKESKFKNGQIKSETDKEGNLKEYYENGDLKYFRDKKGNTKEYLTGEVLYIEFKDGVTKNYDLDGNLEEKSWNDEIEGEIREGYYFNGKLKWEERRGARKEYYENGQLIFDNKRVLIFYQPDGELMNGVHVEYTNMFPEPFELNGKVYKDYPIKESVFKQGLLHGNQKTWHDVGLLERETQYKNGLKHGFEKFYNESGQIIDLTNYKYGNLFGISKSWFDNGQIESEHFHGDDNVPSRQWYESGQLYLEEINGVKKYWDESGNQIKDSFKNFNSKK